MTDARSLAVQFEKEVPTWPETRERAARYLRDFYQENLSTDAKCFTDVNRLVCVVLGDSGFIFSEQEAREEVERIERLLVQDFLFVCNKVNNTKNII